MAKYDDTKTMGRSKIAPFKPGEDWRSRHERRRKLAMSARDALMNFCREHAVTMQINNEGHHWIFRYRKHWLEWWPSSAKVVIDKQWDKGIHCHDYLQVMKLLSDRILPEEEPPDDPDPTHHDYSGNFDPY